MCRLCEYTPQNGHPHLQSVSIIAPGIDHQGRSDNDELIG